MIKAIPQTVMVKAIPRKVMVIASHRVVIVMTILGVARVIQMRMMKMKNFEYLTRM